MKASCINCDFYKSEVRLLANDMVIDDYYCQFDYPVSDEECCSEWELLNTVDWQPIDRILLETDYERQYG